MDKHEICELYNSMEIVVVCVRACKAQEDGQRVSLCIIPLNEVIEHNSCCGDLLTTPPIRWALDFPSLPFTLNYVSVDNWSDALSHSARQTQHEICTQCYASNI